MIKLSYIGFKAALNIEENQMATVVELEKVVSKQNEDISLLKRRVGELRDEISLVNNNVENMQRKLQSDLKRLDSRITQ